MKGGVLRGAVRFGVFLGSIALGCLLVVALTGVLLLRFPVQRGQMTLDLVPDVDRLRRRLTHESRGTRVLFVGDSVLNPAVPNPVPTMTQIALHRIAGGRRVRLFPLSFPGWSLTGQYCLLDEMRAMAPDRVVLEVNFRGLSARSAQDYPQTELAGFIAAPRFLEALRLPLSRSGITANRLFFYRLVVASGGLSLWSSLLHLQALVYDLREPVERALEEALATRSLDTRRAVLMLTQMGRVYATTEKDRENRAHVEGVLGPVLAGLSPSYPPLATLGAMVRRFSAMGTKPIVWIAPINVEHLRILGVDPAGLTRSVASVRQVVESSGGRLVDLHAVLRNRDFSDAGDHPTAEGEFPGTALLGNLLAEAIVR